MPTVMIYCSVTRAGELLRISDYITAESALRDLQWPLPEEPFEMWVCKLSEGAAVTVKGEQDLKKAWKLCKTYSHYMQKCADISGAKQ